MDDRRHIQFLMIGVPVIAIAIAWALASEIIGSKEYLAWQQQHAGSLIVMTTGWGPPQHRIAMSCLDVWRYTWPIWGACLAVIAAVELACVRRLRNPTGEGPTEPLVVLGSFRTAAEACLIRSVLGDVAIRAEVIGELTAQNRCEAPGWVRIMVLHSELERAQEVVQERQGDAVSIDWEQVDVGEVNPEI